MLRGETIHLRPVRESDLDTLFLYLSDIRNRGDYFPLTFASEPGFRRQFQENGYWSEDKGLLLIVRPGAEIIGHIEFFKPVAYLDGYELSYLIYDSAETGKGVTSEAVALLTGYLFDTKKVNRIQLVIHPHNLASRRVAEKNGFSEEGTTRGAWYHRGQYHDVKVYVRLRHEHIIPK